MARPNARCRVLSLTDILQSVPNFHSPESSVTHTTNEQPVADRQQEMGSVTPEEIRRVLAEILQSPPFRSSMQIQKILKFLVLETLAGHGETLKERNIGTSLFERPPDYDTNADPIVRLRVAEVRKRLALYYQGARDETVLIQIPSGSFRAVFERSGRSHQPLPAELVRESGPLSPPAEPRAAQADPGVEVQAEQQSPARSWLRKWWVLAAAAAVLAIVPLAVLHYTPKPEERAFNGFWSPVLENANTILVGMGNNPLYELSNAGEDEYYKTHPKTPFEEMGLHPYIPLTPDSPVNSKYINPAVSTYLTIGDVGALSSIEYILAQQHRKLDIRFVNDLTYGDLRQNPTILIGAHNNIWTLTMTEDLRFGFQGHSAIIDRADPKRRWTANFDRSETYGIVARVLNAWNGKVVLIVAGVGYSGTRAAGDFIANPQSIYRLSKSLPKNWENKNVEVVLHTTVRNQVPGTPEVVAAYSW